MHSYPAITDAMLVPFRAIDVQPGCLDDPACPYPPAIKAFLKRLIGDTTPIKAFDDEDLEKEINDIYRQLQDVPVTTDTKENIAMFKVRADLLTKMVSLKERAMNARDMARFQRTVVEVLDQIITPAQRNEFLEKLTPYV
jgi:hypothetical protein